MQYLNEFVLVILKQCLLSKELNLKEFSALGNLIDEDIEVVISVFDYLATNFKLNLNFSVHDTSSLEFEKGDSPEQSWLLYKEYCINGKQFIEALNLKYQEGQDFPTDIEICPSNKITRNEFPELFDQLTVEISKNEESNKLIIDFLKTYLNHYENGDLFIPNKNMAKIDRHYDAYLQLIYKAQKAHGLKNIVLSMENILDVRRNEWRPIESVLLMENKGYIKIKSIGFYHQNTYGLQTTIDLLKDYHEIKSLCENWLVLGNLSFRPNTGHAYNGDTSHHFQKGKAAYKALLMFINNPEKEFSLEDIEQEAFGDNSVNDNQRKNRINNLVNKSIIAPLGMNKPNSRVNILGSEGSFRLSAISNRL